MIRPIGYCDIWNLSARLFQYRKSLEGFTDLTNDLEKDEWKSAKVAVAKCLNMIEPQGPRPEVIGVGIHRLSPKEAKPWSSDTGGELSSLVFHLAVVTNPLCTIYSGQVGLHMQAGMLAYVQTDAPNSAINMGETPVLHLVIEVKRPQQKTETIQ